MFSVVVMDSWYSEAMSISFEMDIRHNSVRPIMYE